MKSIWLLAASIIAVVAIPEARADGPGSQLPPGPRAPAYASSSAPAAPAAPARETHVRSPGDLGAGILLATLATGVLATAPAFAVGGCIEAPEDKCRRATTLGVVLAGVGAAGVVGGVAIIATAAKSAAASPVMRLYAGPTGGNAVVSF